MNLPLTRRQQTEAEIYDHRAVVVGAELSDQDLAIDPNNPPYPNREHVDFLDYLFGALGDPTGKRVLEVGCGSGNLTTYLAIRGAHAVGVDVSAEMCALAARRAAVNLVESRTQFVVQPIETLDEPDGSMDAIIANQVLHHLELDLAMANIARLLRPGGLALFAEPVFLLPDVVRNLRYASPVLRLFPSSADTPDERPLDADAIKRVTAHFGRVEITPFQATTRIQNFVHLSDRTFERLERLDRHLLMRVPGSNRLARYVTLVMSPAEENSNHEEYP